MITIALENSTNLWKYDIRYTLITNWYKNLGHTNILLEHWAQLLQEKLGTRRWAKKLEGTLTLIH